MALTDAFHGKRVLVTGHTGFKGAWLSIWLEALGAQVIGISLDHEDDRCVYFSSGIGRHILDRRADIRDLDRLVDLFAAEEPELVFHLAAQALVLESYRAPVDTFSVNVMGTVHVLEAIRHTPSVRAAVMVTTDKCYENAERVHAYKETDPLGGHDPYSASKGAAEIIISSYRRSFFSSPGSPGIASARSGNVIGGGDRAADRLVPDLVRAIEEDRALHIRHPDSVRPWQHVLEPLHGYLLLAEHLLSYPEKYAGAWNFGPMPEQVFTVRELTEAMLAGLGKGRWVDGSDPGNPHEAKLLMLAVDKAWEGLGWKPQLSFAETVRLTADWYVRAPGFGAMDLCRSQIHEYAARANKIS